MATKTAKPGQAGSRHGCYNPETERRRTAQANENRKAQLRALNDISPSFPKKPQGYSARVRKKMHTDLRLHLLTCYPEAFPLPFSADHDNLIEQLQTAIIEGQLKVEAMPRGSGKTTLMVRACGWAILENHRRFVAIIAATDSAAQNLLKALLTEFTHNPQLRKYYPQELHTLHACKGSYKGQTTQQRWGEDLTGLDVRNKRIIFGNVPKATTAGAVISAEGITGHIRGQQVTRPSGRIDRPDLALVDDPSTKESDTSEIQTETRHQIMCGDVLGMAGPGKEFSALCSCTVIREGGLASRLLDPEFSPDWHGHKSKMVYQWPKRMDLWEQYGTLRSQELNDGGDGKLTTAFYENHREAMDEGAKVGWEHRKLPSDVSALQHAFNLRFRDERAFFAEYQNEPLEEQKAVAYDLSPAGLAERIIDIDRGQVIDATHVVTAFIDVQKDMLYYLVCCWTPTGRGCVIDWGAYPDQQATEWTKQKARHKLSAIHGQSLDASIYGGLGELVPALFAREWTRADGAMFQIARIGVDYGWGFSSDVVRRFCSESPDTWRLHPMKGIFIGANSKPWAELAKKRGQTTGLHWRILPPRHSEYRAREIHTDVNWWKSATADRLTCPLGSGNALTIAKHGNRPHDMLLKHISAEDPVREISKVGNEVTVWKHSRLVGDNDFWDCLVGCGVLASVEGVKLQAAQKPKRQTPKKRSTAATGTKKAVFQKKAF